MSLLYIFVTITDAKPLFGSSLSSIYLVRYLCAKYSLPPCTPSHAIISLLIKARDGIYNMPRIAASLTFLISLSDAWPLAVHTRRAITILFLHATMMCTPSLAWPTTMLSLLSLLRYLLRLIYYKETRAGHFSQPLLRLAFSCIVHRFCFGTFWGWGWYFIIASFLISYFILPPAKFHIILSSQPAIAVNELQARN